MGGGGGGGGGEGKLLPITDARFNIFDNDCCCFSLFLGSCMHVSIFFNWIDILISYFIIYILTSGQHQHGMLFGNTRRNI